MGLKEEEISSLLAKNQRAIELLKGVLYDRYSDLKGIEKLADGTIFDDVFLLRYLLSSKIPLSSKEDIIEAELVPHIMETIKWREQQCGKCKTWGLPGWEKLESPDEKKMLSIIPLLRTGELPNGFSVTFLPVKMINFDVLLGKAKNKSFEGAVFNFMLYQKEKIFRELDAKTRETGILKKAVVVYDLDGLSFGDIYRLTGFFKIVGKHSKKFKVLFPQTTHSTVILNSPGSYVLKMFSGSKKQKVMKANDFLETYQAQAAVPKTIGGSAVWPLDSKNHWISSDKASADEFNPALEVPLIPGSDKSYSGKGQTSVVGRKSSGVFHLKRNKHMLTNLERQMVKMKKGKVFSIDILDDNQELDISFRNLKTKPAKVLISYEDSASVRRTESHSLKPGMNRICLNLKSASTVGLVYVDRTIEAADKQKKGGVRKVVKKGKKIVAHKNKSKNIADFNRIRLAKGEFFGYDEGDADLALLKDMGKVFFRFDITDGVVPGSYGATETKDGNNLFESKVANALDASGELPPQESRFESKRNLTEDGLVEYDDRSVISSATWATRIRESGDGRAGFFTTLATAFGLDI